MHQLRIWSFDPYPITQWVDKTNFKNVGKLFPEITKDMKKYRIETPFLEDIPKTFIFKKHGRNFLVGNDASIIGEFAKHMNINLIPIFLPNMDLEKIFRIISFNNLELSVHSFSMHYLLQSGRSYPVDFERWCIMVPFRNELPKKKLVFKAFDGTTWLAIGLGVVFIAFVLRFIDPPTTTGCLGKNLLKSLSIMMYSSNQVKRIPVPSALKCVLYAFVFCLGFILYSFYTSFLARFCTTLVFRNTIDTVEDLINENLRIMIIDYETSAIRLQANYDEKFFQLLYPMPYYDVVTHRNSFNNNFAYSISESDWIHLDKQQSKLKKPLFRFSKICYGRHFTMFPLQSDSHLKPHLDDFILRVKEGGLDVAWKDQSFGMAITMKYSRMLVDKSTVINPLSLEFFENVFIIWLIGIGLSMIGFVTEVLHKKIVLLRFLFKKK
ncbi:uncharacterized protein LOC129919199 [Episyrphus balteatus]|uniref:uncharacterized protein LOC129919199 n=1 Tax=Episyrphus balteatus TaxID=286459 RepID=UPI0024869569|nr:uncharacterized protein LOC129919199 [Episyrphus balteatus]